jgi:hypothetical protein
MKKIFSLISILVFISLKLSGQSVTIDPSNNNGGAILKAQSTSAGTLIPNLTTTQRTAIASPQKGLLVFDTVTGTFWFHNGTVWSELVSTNSSGNGWATYNSGTELYNTNSTRVNISPVSNIGAITNGAGVDGSLVVKSPTAFFGSSYLTFDGNNIQARYFNPLQGGKQDNNMRINPFGGNVGIGLVSPSDKLHVLGTMKVEGSMKITGNNTLEFGSGVQFKDIAAGRIGYQVYGSQNALDIVGAGQFINDRRINLWAEAGTSIKGGLYSPSTGGLNIVPIGAAEYIVSESNNGLSSFINFTNIAGFLIESGTSDASINVDDALSGNFKLDPTIVSQYTKIIAISAPSFSGSAVIPSIPLLGSTAVSGFIGEIGSRILTLTSGPNIGTFFQVFCVVDDFPFTGGGALKGTVIFYGIK